MIPTDDKNPYVDGTYLNSVQDWHASDSPWKASKVYQMIEKHQLQITSVYDVGCGVGEVLVELQSKLDPSIECVGFDISPQAIEIAKPKENAQLSFLNEDYLESALPHPDLLLLLDVFEHVPDYLGFLKQLRKRSAFIIFHIPLDACAKEIFRRSKYLMHMREQYGHLHYFTKETAFATVSDVGFEVVDWFFTNDYEISDGLVPRKLTKSRLSYEVRRVLYRVKPALAVSLFPNFNLLVLAKGAR